MATIQTSIELQDKFTGTLNQIIGSVNSGLSAMEELHRTMSGSVDTVSFDAARRSVNQTAAAVQQLDRAVQRVELPEMAVPAPQYIATSEAPVYRQTEIPPPVVGQPEPVAAAILWQTDIGNVLENTDVEALEVPVVAPKQSVSAAVSLVWQPDIGNVLANTDVEALEVPVIAPKQPVSAAAALLWLSDIGNVLENTDVEALEVPVVAPKQPVSAAAALLWQSDIGSVLENTDVEALKVPVVAPKQPVSAAAFLVWQSDTRDLFANTDIEAPEVPVVAPRQPVSAAASLLWQSDTGNVLENTDIKALEMPMVAPKQPVSVEAALVWQSDIRDLFANTDVEALEVPVIAPKQPELAEIPLLWQSDTIDVFANSGAEGFEREVRGAISLLNGLNQARRQIAAEAVQADIFPVNYVSRFEIETAFSAVELEAAADTSEAVDKINALRKNAGGVTVPVSVSAEAGALTAAFDQITEKAADVQGQVFFGNADAAEMMTGAFGNNARLERLDVNIDVSGFDFAKAKLSELSERYRELKAPIPAFNVGAAVPDAFGDGWTFDTFGDGFTEDAFKFGAAWGDGAVGNIGSVLNGIFGGGGALIARDCLPKEDYHIDKINRWGLSDGMGDISDSTGSVSYSLSISEEDLRYLRDIAESETVNRFTTAEITVEQHNTNNISSKMDLNDVINGLTDAVDEAVLIITEGVHV